MRTKVMNEELLARWREAVIRDGGELDYRARLILQALSTYIDRGDWTIAVNRSEMAEVIGMPKSTLYKYFDEAIESAWVSQVEVAKGPAGHWVPVLALMLPES